MRQNRLFLIAATLVFTCGNIFAQDTREPQKLSEEQRIEMLTKRMQDKLFLDDETSAKFAPLYKAYIQEMRACHKTPDPQAPKEERTDERIEQEMKERFAMRQKALDTQEKYFTEFQKILNARQLEQVFEPKHHKGRPMAFHKRNNPGQKPPMPPKGKRLPAPGNNPDGPLTNPD